MENIKLNNAVIAFQKKYPMVTSADIQTFILGYQANDEAKSKPSEDDILANDEAKSKPSEDDILDTIINSVFIRGIELEPYRYNFTNEQSGLYDRLLKLFEAKSKPSEDDILDTIINSVFIRGIELEPYRRNFTNEQSGLYDRLINLFNK